MVDPKRDPPFSTEIIAFASRPSPPPILPTVQASKPEKVISLQDSAAVFDCTYSKYPHVFKLLGTKGREWLVRCESEDQMNSWIGVISELFLISFLRFKRRVNCISSFKITLLRSKLSASNWQTVKIDRILCLLE
jgi:hypothetical protein